MFSAILAVARASCWVMNTFADAGLVSSRTNTKASAHVFFTRPAYIVFSPVTVETFGGLDLVGDPGTVGWNGAVDLLNVDLDKPGAIRSRDGYAKFTSAVALSAYHSVAPFYTSGGGRQLLAAFGGASGAINALDTSGAVVAAQSAPNSTFASVARFAAPGSEFAYVSASAPGVTTVVYRWDGATWTTPAWVTTTPTGRHLATWQNRLANARYDGTANGNSVSTVRFSAISSGPPPAATPETWNANDFVELDPGDGEEITALITWRDSLFAFKESKFFVFYGTSTDSAGNPIFNYRPVLGQGIAAAGVQSSYRAVAASPDGVYFLNRRGIWFTSGGPASLVSTAVDPIFRGGPNSFFASSALNQAQIALAAMTWHDNRLYIAYPSGTATTNDRVLVYTPSTGTWVLWDLPAAALCPFRVSSAQELMFAYASGTKDIGRHSSSYTQDGGDGLTTGAAITSRYRAGFSDLSSPDMKRIHSWRLQGSGTPTLKVSTDFGALDTGAAVTLGISPAVAEGVRRYAPRGRQVSWQVGATTAWSLNNLIANIAGKRKSGEHGT